MNDYVRFAQSEMDAYSELQYAWTFVRENRVADFQVKGEPDPASLETLESVFFTFQRSRISGPGQDAVGLDSRHGQEIEVHVLAATGKSPRGLYRSGAGFASPGGIGAGVGRVGLPAGLLGRMRQQHVQLRVHGTRLDGGRAGLHAGRCSRFARRADRNRLTAWKNSIRNGWAPRL